MKSWLIAALFLLALPWALGGCYYTHLAVGQGRLLLARKPADSVRNDPKTPGGISRALELVAEVRTFAETLELDVGERYASYAPWPGDRVITTVVATQPNSLDSHLFRFPLVGAVPYKGFFEQDRALREAAKLKDRGLDVCVLPVRAYSTLGWFDDPVTGPMLRMSESRLVEVILHELVHATVYAPGAADFNEGLATFVGQEAAVRFEALRGEEAASRTRVREDREIARRFARFRKELRDLYSEVSPGAARNSRRGALEDELRKELAAYPATSFDAARLARETPLNDACQAISGTYESDLPLYEALLDSLDGDLPALLRRAAEAAEGEDPRLLLFGRKAEKSKES